MSLCIIAVGGADPGVGLHELGDADRVAQSRVIAADSGVAHARRLGLVPDIVVGDFDSAREDDLAWASGTGSRLVAHNPDKDATDFDLAMQLAIDDGADEIVVIGMFGGRADHLLANMAVLASPRFRRAAVRAVDATTEVWVLHPSADRSATVTGGTATPIVVPLQAGLTVSLLASGGDAVVTTAGLRWNLCDTTLGWDASLGVSNVVERDDPTVLVTSGVVLAVVAKSPPPAIPPL